MKLGKQFIDKNDLFKVINKSHFLGVHSKASNFAVLSELGQYPLVLSALVSCINFGCILCNLMIIHLLIKHIESSVITQTASG